MEFIQFHPTGMVYPPSVRGILVTEGVRGEGGILKNSAKANDLCLKTFRRFMYGSNRRHARRRLAICDGRQKCASSAGTFDTRPRCTVHRPRSQSRARFAARWSFSRYCVDQRKKSRTRPMSISRKSCRVCIINLSSLADLDITTTPMEVGPTTHYIMGGIRVDGDTQASTIPGLFAAGECAAGINGANRSGRKFAFRSFGFRQTRRRICREICSGK